MALQAFGECQTVALTKYVGELKTFRPRWKQGTHLFPAGIECAHAAQPWRRCRTFAGRGDVRHGSGHVHANGLAMELYGRPDPRRGPRTRHKLLAGPIRSIIPAPAHNTVIVNGQSDYSSTGAASCINWIGANAAPGEVGISPRHSVRAASFRITDRSRPAQRDARADSHSPRRLLFDVFPFARGECTNSFTIISITTSVSRWLEG